MWIRLELQDAGQVADAPSARCASPARSGSKECAIRPPIMGEKIGASSPLMLTPWLIRLPEPDGATSQWNRNVVAGTGEVTSSKERPAFTFSSRI
jgi:hypothetical protein